MSSVRKRLDVLGVLDVVARLSRARREAFGAPHLVLAIAALAAMSAGVPELDRAPTEAATLASEALVTEPSPPSASRTVDLSVASASLGRDMNVTVFLPPGYDSEADRRYPVVYMLHGLGGDRTQWVRAGLLEGATRLMANGTIEPFIIVLPDGENGYWVDHAEDGPRFGDYVSTDIVTLVDRQYRTLAGRDARAIGGMSMGGHGALQLGLNNPEVFRVIGAHSVALRTKEQAFSFFGDRAYFEAHDPVSILRAHPEDARQLVIAIDIGDDDPWAEAAGRFHGQLETAGLVHTWSLEDGAHDEAYWHAHIEDYLKYYDQAFRDRFGSPGE
ncbi:MAG: hypothetical protein IT299_03945 [Dehalococcoidia bacterium]|nr:hypothetical protein [Dehalococcoidia bacterium]